MKFLIFVFTMLSFCSAFASIGYTCAAHNPQTDDLRFRFYFEDGAVKGVSVDILTPSGQWQNQSQDKVEFKQFYANQAVANARVVYDGALFDMTTSVIDAEDGLKSYQGAMQITDFDTGEKTTKIVNCDQG